MSGESVSGAVVYDMEIRRIGQPYRTKEDKGLRQAMTDQGLPEPQFSYDGMFIVRLTRPVEFNKWIKRWASKFNENQIRILESINDDPGISIVQLSKDLDISTTTIEKHLDRLKTKGILERVGPQKTGKWQINKINP